MDGKLYQIHHRATTLRCKSCKWMDLELLLALLDDCKLGLFRRQGTQERFYFTNLINYTTHILRSSEFADWAQCFIKNVLQHWDHLCRMQAKILPALCSFLLALLDDCKLIDDRRQWTQERSQCEFGTITTHILPFKLWFTSLKRTYLLLVGCHQTGTGDVQVTQLWLQLGVQLQLQ